VKGDEGLLIGGDGQKVATCGNDGDPYDACEQVIGVDLQGSLADRRE